MSANPINILLLTGIALLLGAFGGKVFKKLKVPQVVGYIVIGIVLGESVLGFIKQSTIDLFTPLINLALGFIAFRIGIELKQEVFKRYGRAIYVALLGEGLGAFIVVTALVTLVTRQLYLGLLLGAIASATDPATTIEVLREYKSRGPLTTIVQAIVALDDGLSLIIYGFASVFAKSLLLQEAHFTFVKGVGEPLLELVKVCLLGTVIGLVFSKGIRFIKEKEYMLSFSVAAILATIGISLFLHIDFLLTTLVLGTVFGNFAPQESRQIGESLERVTPPIYILFFVLVGARLKAAVFLNTAIVLLVFVYLIGRSSGKMLGAYSGATISKAKRTVRRYLGMALFPQAGVAIGLAMVIYHNFSLLSPAGEHVGMLVVTIITATTFVLQLLGPGCVKIAATKADELWRNVTEEDIIESSRVCDFMRTDIALIKEDATLDKIIETIKEKESYHFPVVNNNGELTGLISLGELRSVFRETQLDNVILAEDVAVPVYNMLYKDQPLKEAMEIFNKREVDYLPVVESEGEKKVVGILEYRPLIEAIHRKLFERQHSLED